MQIQAKIIKSCIPEIFPSNPEAIPCHPKPHPCSHRRAKVREHAAACADARKGVRSNARECRAEGSSSGRGRVAVIARECASSARMREKQRAAMRERPGSARA